MAERREGASQRVLFVCTGNTCRSPMAAVLLKDRLGGKRPWRVSSAGITGLPGAPASPESVAVLGEWGLDLSAHRSRALTRRLVERSDLVVVMARVHYDVMVERHPDAREKILLLGSFLPPEREGDGDIPDPIGGDRACYRAIRDRIAEAVEGLALFLSEW